MIKIGWKAGSEDAPLDLLEGAVAADQYGFDLMDIGYPSPAESLTGQSSLNWTWLGAAAVKTHHIHLGPGVNCGTLRSDTAAVAQAAQTLAVVASGRSYISINFSESSTQSNSEESWIDQNEQQDMTAEAIDLIRQLWSGQPVTYNGHYFHIRNAKINTHCEQDISIYLTLQLPGNAYFAGYFGDGFITTGGMHPQVYQRIIKEFERGAREAGKNPAAMPRMVELPVAFHSVEDQPMEMVYQELGSSFFASMPCHDASIPVTASDSVKPLAEPRVETVVCASADPNQHAAVAQDYIDMGFDTLLFRPVGRVPLEFIRAYGRDVLPRIRASNMRSF